MTNITVEKTEDLSSFLKPQSIAIIGASNNPSKISGRPIEYLKRYNYQGEIYPVNPNYDEIQGLKAYKSIDDLPDGIDLVVIAIAAKHVISTLKTCIEKNVKSVMILSSGFAEMGEEGRVLQEEISTIAKESGIFVIGPNCQGVANLKDRSITTFSTAFVEGELVTGPSAILSQSGAVAAMVYNMQKEEGGGIKYWASTGNESDVSIPRIVNHILEDPDINVVQLYIESIKDKNEIVSMAKKSQELDKPVLILKPGRTEEAQKAASSHTGALAAQDIVVDKVLNHYGLVRVDDVNELSSFAKVFKLSKRVKGKNVAILTNSGGLGVMMVDKCKEYGLNIANFKKSTIEKLSEVLPVFASVQNPIDVTAQLLNDKDLLSNTIPILMEDENVDIILFGLGIIGKGYDMDKIMSEIVTAQKEGEKLIGVAWVGSAEGKCAEFNQQGVPAFEDPTMCIKAFAKYAEYCTDERKINFDVTPNKDAYQLEVAESFRNLKQTDGFLSEYDSKSILKDYLPIGDLHLVKNQAQLESISDKLEYPVVMKVNSSAIQHKSEVGGVKLNIKNAEELNQAYNELLNNDKLPKVDGEVEVLIEKMVDPGFEISLGLKKDPVFGPIIMVASGGIYIEVLKDFQLLIPPVSLEEAKEAVNSLTMSPLLHGARGKAKKDVDQLCEVIVQFSNFVLKNEEILEEVDLNPIIVGDEGKGVNVVDALIKLSWSDDGDE